MFPPFRSSLAVIPALLLLGACTADNPVSPTRMTAPTRSSRSTSASATDLAVVHPTTTKYREQTHPFTSARAGSATVTARALLGKDGFVTLDATTGELDASAAPGSIDKVQVKSFTTAGKLLQTTNAANSGPVFSSRIFGRVRHSTIQTQANVTGIDAHRTDVVTVTSLVQFRPDLAVTNIASPTSVGVGTPVSVSATLSELNHDVGAHADCVLSVDGTEVERLKNVWVANGDEITCAFNDYTFNTVGKHTIEVRGDNVVPGDWDTSNNVLTKTIDVVQPVTVMDEAFVAISQYNVKNWSTTDNGEVVFAGLTAAGDTIWQPDGSGESDTTWVNRQTISFYADAFATFATDPVTLVFDVWSGGQSLAHHEMTGVNTFFGQYGPQRFVFADGWRIRFGVGTASRATATPTFDMAQVALGQLFVDKAIFFNAQLTDVFASDGTTETGQTVYYTTSGYNQNSGTTPVTLGNDFRMRLSMTGGGAPYRFDRWFGPSPTNNPAYVQAIQGPLVFDHTFPLTHGPFSYQNPQSCWTARDWSGRVWNCTSDGATGDIFSAEYANFLGDPKIYFQNPFMWFNPNPPAFP